MSSYEDMHYQKLKRGEVKHIKASSSALQKENIAVEKKLCALKEKMKKDKEERDKMGGGPRWKSSKDRKPNSASSDTKTKKKTIKVLSDQPIENYKQERKPQNTSSANLCGQCDERKAKVRCIECVEAYCADCYKHFHSRGALRKHTWKSVEQIKLEEKLKQQMENINSKSAPAKRDQGSMSSSVDRSDSASVISDHSRTQKTHSVSGNPSVSQTYHDEKKSVSVDNTIYNTSTSQLDSKNTSLWYGEYNEAESAASFSEALNEWRNAGQSDSPQQSKGINSRVDSHNKSSLLHGEYNEAESAASFSDALNAWRKGGRCDTPQQTERCDSVTSQGTGTSDITSNDKTDVKVIFSESPALSYLDRIDVRQHKKNPKDVISVKFPSLTAMNQQQLNPTSPESVSPVENRDEITLSPCILSLHCTSPSKPSPSPTTTIIEIEQCSNEDAETLPTSNATPIVLYEDSDTDTEINLTVSCSMHTLDETNVIDKNIMNKLGDLRHLKDNTEWEHANETTVWKPPPVHVNMDRYFLIGNDDEVPLSEQNRSESTNDGVEEKNSLDLHHEYDLMWRPDSSLANTLN